MARIARDEPARMPIGRYLPRPAGPRAVAEARAIRRALDRQVQDASFSVIPILLPGAKDPPLGFLRLETWVDLKGGVGSKAGLDLLQQAIHGQAPLAAEIGLPDPRAALCPFRGLEPFREEDEAFFVGREAFTRVLIDKVGQRPLIGVVGASGSGKSSVVLAGLVPAL